MDTIIRNSPSSNTWAKFEDSDEVREITNAPCSPSSINEGKEHMVNAQLVSATQLEQSILTKKDQNCAQSKLQIN